MWRTPSSCCYVAYQYVFEALNSIFLRDQGQYTSWQHATYRLSHQITLQQSSSNSQSQKLTDFLIMTSALAAVMNRLCLQPDMQSCLVHISREC